MQFSEGARIRVKKRTRKGVVVYEGTVMPTAFSKNIVIKLDNGYNIGIRPENAEIEVISGTEGRAERDTSRAERQMKKEARGKPTISILSTGGTIASKVDYRTGAVTAQFTTEDILEAIPELEELANIEGKVIYSILSENMRPEHWMQLAKVVYNEVKRGADGIIITHGTDTMGYTAAALSFMLRSPVPVVLVGSQRSADRPSSDSAMNAICAAKVATSDIAEVTIVMHGGTSDDFCYVHRGTRVRKMHTSARDAFRSINALPLAKVHYGSKAGVPRIEDLKIEILDENYRRRGEGEPELRAHIEKRCALVKFYPGADPEVIEFFLERYKGVVIEGTGLGHVSSEWIPKIKRAVERGVVVVMASQCLYGRVCDRVYDTGRDLLKAGVIEGGDMLPETALVKLMWALGATSDVEEVKKIMQTNVVGELSERTCVLCVES
ncbi:Glu-tRNA(Gln) amidotransferase subunit GatD [Candidatus Alkanophaga liquidiphilum]